MTRAASLFLALLTVCAASTANALTLHAPAHSPPALSEGSGEGKPSFQLGLDVSSVRAPGLRLLGPGGFWELSLPIAPSYRTHIRAEGSALSGDIEPASAGSRRTHAMRGALEAGLSHAWDSDRGRLGVYAGLSAQFLSLDIADPMLVQLAGGNLQAEPDHAFSLLAGLPLSLIGERPLAGGWRLGAGASLMPYAGASFLTYGLAGPLALGRTRRNDPNLLLALRLRLLKPAWRVSLEAGAGRTASAGNNDAASSVYGGLSVRVF